MSTHGKRGEVARAIARVPELTTADRIGADERVGAAVDEENAARAERRLWVEQERHRGGDLFRRAEPAERYGEVADRVTVERVRKSAVEERSSHGPRCDRVQPHAGTRPRGCGRVPPH